MSAVLHVGGVAFDPDAFLATSDLEPERVFRKSDPRRSWEENGDGTKVYCGFNLAVSEAEFDELERQIEDAIVFLETYKAELSRLVKFPGVAGASIDFGVEQRDVVGQCDRFPAALIRIAGEIGLGIQLSRYPISAEEEEAT